MQHHFSSLNLSVKSICISVWAFFTILFHYYYLYFFCRQYIYNIYTYIYTYNIYIILSYLWFYPFWLYIGFQATSDITMAMQLYLFTQYFVIPTYEAKLNKKHTTRHLFEEMSLVPKASSTGSDRQPNSPSYCDTALWNRTAMVFQHTLNAKTKTEMQMNYLKEKRPCESIQGLCYNSPLSYFFSFLICSPATDVWIIGCLIAEHKRCTKFSRDASHHAYVTFLNILSFFPLVWPGKSRVFSILFLLTMHP